MVFGAGIRRGSLGIDRKRHQIEVMLQVSKFPPQVCGTGPTRTIPKHWPRARTLDTVTGLAVVHTRPQAHRGNTFYEIFEKRARTTMTDDGYNKNTLQSHRIGMLPFVCLLVHLDGLFVFLREARHMDRVLWVMIVPWKDPR